jgi:hypothetical protein
VTPYIHTYIHTYIYISVPLHNYIVHVVYLDKEGGCTDESIRIDVLHSAIVTLFAVTVCTGSLV